HQLPRPRARDRHAVERRGGRAHRHIRRWLRGPEPAQVELLGKARPHDEEAVLRETRNRQVPHDPAGGIEHGSEREAPGPGYARGKDPIEPGARSAPGDLVLAIVGGLVQAYRPARSEEHT